MADTIYFSQTNVLWKHFNFMSEHCIFFRIEHEKLHAKHKGHEAMHMEMILILFSTLIVAQVLLVKWKKHYYKSFQVNS